MPLSPQATTGDSDSSDFLGDGWGVEGLRLLSLLHPKLPYQRVRPLTRRQGWKGNP